MSLKVILLSIISITFIQSAMGHEQYYPESIPSKTEDNCIIYVDLLDNKFNMHLTYGVGSANGRPETD